MSLKKLDKDSDDTILEHLILEKVGVLKGHHFLPKKKSKKEGAGLWFYFITFMIIFLAIFYLKGDKIADYNLKFDNVDAATKIMYLDEFPNGSLYSYCKSIGIEESVVRELNPWINKQASNISADAEIVVPLY